MTLSTNRGSENFETVHGFDLVIDGSGADPLWFTSLFSQHTLDLLELGLGGPLTADRLQEAIGYDLAVTDVTPKLFLPTLSDSPRARVPQPELPRLVVGPGARRRHLYADQTQRHKEKR